VRRLRVGAAEGRGETVRGLSRPDWRIVRGCGAAASSGGTVRSDGGNGAWAAAARLADGEETCGPAGLRFARKDDVCGACCRRGWRACAVLRSGWRMVRMLVVRRLRVGAAEGRGETVRGLSRSGWRMVRGLAVWRVCASRGRTRCAERAAGRTEGVCGFVDRLAVTSHSGVRGAERRRADIGRVDEVRQAEVVGKAGAGEVNGGQMRIAGERKRDEKEGRNLWFRPSGMSSIVAPDYFAGRSLTVK